MCCWRCWGSTFTRSWTPFVSPVAAVDPLDGPRRWFAFIPTLPAIDGALPSALDRAASVQFDEGTAIRTEVMTLDDARAVFAAILPDDVDVTLYPVDE